MAVPAEFLSLVADIKAWVDKYGGVDSEAQSPFQSESFGGYSYSKGTTSNGDSNATWKTVFGARLNKWRKVRV